MITSLALRNFKPFAALQNIKLAPLTLIYGPNSAGKSSIIQSLLLLQQSISEDRSSRGLGPLNPSGPGHDFGTIKAMINKQRSKSVFELGIGFEEPEPIRRTMASRRGRTTQNRAHMEFRLLSDLDTQHPNYNRHWMPQIEFSQGEFTIGFKQNRRRAAEDSQNRFSLESDPIQAQSPLAPTGIFTLKDRDSAKNLYDYLEHIELNDRVNSETLDILHLESQENVESHLRRITFRSQPDSLGLLFPSRSQRRANWDRDNLSVDLEERLWHLTRSFHGQLQRALQNLVYLGPLRLPESKTLTFSNDTVDNVGQLGDRSKEAFFQSSQRAQSTINQWLSRLEIDYRVTVDEMTDPIRGTALSMTLKKRGNDTVIRGVYDVGFGISQVLPVIIQGVISGNQTICVEQPEIHLHPRLQAHLGDFLIDTATPNRRSSSNQWIVETHSELLIQRIQRRIREQRLSNENVSVLYVEPDPKAGSKITELRLDAEGRFLDEWPRGFFSESFEELMAFNQAGSPDVIGEI